MMTPYFAELLDVLADRANLAATSDLRFANEPLRQYLTEAFGRAYGQADSFLGDPTFEAVYGWQSAEPTMGDLAGELLASELVSAMDAPPKELARDYRFARDQHPYTHQLQAWKLLANEDPQSLIVASGTGSGKTECFMVPILDQLVRLRNVNRGKLIGVRALFLYPLNALINSQRERFRAWTHAFGEDIRFCLYNGNTPEKQPARFTQNYPSEILDRFSLRSAPPPILVTNATMLEYMLVRTNDAPILNQSQGLLKWVILDEAHSYIGSQAAEMALLIRRVLLAFGVTPDQVRFVATSATIGDPEGDAGRDLKRFLGDLAGVSQDRVHIVAGKRAIPRLLAGSADENMSISEIERIDPNDVISDERYLRLTNNSHARKIRDLFVLDPTTPPVAKLSEVCKQISRDNQAYDINDQKQALRWLDLLSGTRSGTADGQGGEAFLPLRGHLFHQTLTGIWACSDSNCSEKAGTKLGAPEWPFGAVYLDPRKHCRCGSPAYEVVRCDDCGTVYLLAGIDVQGFVTHLRKPGAIDEFELDDESPDGGDGDGDDGDESLVDTDKNQSKLLIVNRKFETVDPINIDRASRQQVDASVESLRVWGREPNRDEFECPACDGRETDRRPLFKSCRIGAPYFLSSILPTLLEYAPDGENSADHPCRGRRLLTFNDSRQGTARIAARLQQDAERGRIRALVYHVTLEMGRAASSDRATALKSEIEQLEVVHTSQPNPVLREMIATKRTELETLSRPVPISFDRLSEQIALKGRDFEKMLEHYRQFAPGSFGNANGPIELARMFLMREFARRPKRSNNLETLGMVSVQYPSLSLIADVPQMVKESANFDIDVWRNFLKICLDFYVRGGGSLAISPNWRNWIGVPTPQTLLVPSTEDQKNKYQRRWPRARRSGMTSTLVRLLSFVLKVDIATAEGEDKVDAVLAAAWDSLCDRGLLEQTMDGRVLQPSKLAFAPMDHGWVCPVTRRFLDTTLTGITPYIPRKVSTVDPTCQQVELPLYPEPFSGVTNDLERIRKGREWINSNQEIAELRNDGLWSTFNDRTVEMAPYFTAAEHSAQQDSQTLERYEKAFKDGDLNLLSCSTTMEMGIDIGGINMVAMNNVPPHPSNYLQRAGRAGRRREERSLSMTLCKSNPHDQSVFANSRWAFDTSLPSPRVSLDSASIVQRHVHSYLLSSFLKSRLSNSGQEQTKLTCGMFFLGEDALSEHFIGWLLDNAANESQTIFGGLKQIVRFSIVEDQDVRTILDHATQEIGQIAQDWKIEREQLETESEEIRIAGGEHSPAFRAVTLHKERLEGEYLLRELSTRGFLPAYGFPTNIASFDNMTKDRMSRERGRKSREDNRYNRRELASRDLTTALREYAPGSDVVMDGLVYTSAGVTLNWHIPATLQDVREIQDIRYAWRCSRCGASGSSHSLEGSKTCSVCGSNCDPNNIREFLRPAGFAVDFYVEPSNDVNRQKFVPVETPWIDAQGDWFPLDNPELGKFRASPRGHVFHQSRGINGTGYALCLACGRAEPMSPSGSRPATFDKPHRKLRRAKEEGGECPGSNDLWKVKENITLGFETWTDVFEIHLRSVGGVWLNDVTTARTIAVALRDSLAGLIGIQSTELGCDIKPVRTEDGTTTQAILIFDRFAAGYASTAERNLAEIFAGARKRLECDADCDSACPRCVLDFDQRFAADSLDRKQALEFLNPSWIGMLSVPKEYAYFGDSSRFEHKRLTESIWHSVTKDPNARVRFYVHGDTADWDIGPSSVRELAYRLGGRNINVEIVLFEDDLNTIEEDDRHLLASLADHPFVSIRSINSRSRVGEGYLAAEVFGKYPRRWALETGDDLVFGANWGLSSGPIVQTDKLDNSSVEGKDLSSSVLRPRTAVLGDLELELCHELDGRFDGFGRRFWDFLLIRHPGVRGIIENEHSSLARITYHDRYLFSPLPVGLLGQILAEIKRRTERVDSGTPNVTIVTTECPSYSTNHSRNKLWSDWLSTETRNDVMIEVLNRLGYSASVTVGSKAAVGHGRYLDCEFSCGKTLRLRLDQGVSYWRARHSSFNLVRFDVTSGDIGRQASHISEIAIEVEGSSTPTQIFLRVR